MRNLAGRASPVETAFEQILLASPSCRTDLRRGPEGALVLGFLRWNSDRDPQPLPYLDGPAYRQRGAIDVTLEVWLRTAAMRADGGTPADGGGDEPGADADGGTLTSLYSNAAGCSCTIVELYYGER